MATLSPEDRHESIVFELQPSASPAPGCHRTGLSKTHIYRLIQRGQFPTPARLSERVVAWDEAAVNAWLSERFAAAGGTHA